MGTWGDGIYDNDGALDEASLRRLMAHYAAQPIDGLILAATTGEGLTLAGWQEPKDEKHEKLERPRR